MSKKDIFKGFILQALSWCPWQPNVLATGGGTADRHIRFWNCSMGSSLNSIDAKSQVNEPFHISNVTKHVKLDYIQLNSKMLII